MGGTLPRLVGSGDSGRQSALCQDLITSFICKHVPINAIYTFISHPIEERVSPFTQHPGGSSLVVGERHRSEQQNESTFSPAPEATGALCVRDRLLTGAEEGLAPWGQFR